MEGWKRDGQRDVVMVDIDALVPQDHLLRKIERVMDYDWLYERLSPYYCHDNGRDGTDPVVLVKLVLIQHLFGIPSLRQTHKRILDTISYRWFLGYNLLEEIPHFATVSYAFCKRFPPQLATEIFEHNYCFCRYNSLPYRAWHHCRPITAVESVRVFRGLRLGCWPVLYYPIS